VKNKLWFNMKIVIAVVFVFFSVAAFAQREDVEDDTEQTFKSRGFFGLGLGGLGFGSDPYYGNYFSVGVSGLTGYMFTPQISGGIGLQYQYTNYSDLHYANNLYIGYPFIRYNFKSLFIQADYDLYSLNVNLDAAKARRLYERFFVGIGYAPPSDGGGKLNILASYDLLYPNSYIFPTPFNIRLFYTFHPRNSD